MSKSKSNENLNFRFGKLGFLDTLAKHCSEKEYFHSIVMENITSRLSLMPDMIQNPAAEKLVLYLSL